MKVADNTGAKELMCIRVLGGTGRRYANIGDVVVACVKKAAPGGVVKKGEVVKAVVGSVVRGIQGAGGSYIFVDDTSAVISGDKKPPRTRLFVRVAARQLHEHYYQNISSPPPELL
jgi:large subunit ribosomal protein L14